MKIAADKLQDMFDIANVDKDELYNALQSMGIDFLKKEYRHRWSIDNPTSCYCYVVSEMIYWYKSDTSNTIPMKLIIPNDPALHRFLIFPRNKIVDLTAEQFDNYADVDYTKAKKSMFLQTGGYGPSKRARHLANLMRYI